MAASLLQLQTRAHHSCLCAARAARNAACSWRQLCSTASQRAAVAQQPQAVRCRVQQPEPGQQAGRGWRRGRLCSLQSM